LLGVKDNTGLNVIVTQQAFVMVFGALIACAGLILLFVLKEQAQSKIKLFGQEFEISTPALVVFLAGCAMVVLPLVVPIKNLDKPIVIFNSGTNGSPPPLPPLCGGTTQKAENFTFVLDSCVSSKGDVTCNFTVTNTGQDVLLTFDNDTSVFDNLGGKYGLDKFCIGNECWGRPYALHVISREMISDVSVKVRLVFLGLPQEARQIKKLVVAAKRGPNWGGRYFSLSFRDIALSP
jgi:hypothetical protein